MLLNPDKAPLKITCPIIDDIRDFIIENCKETKKREKILKKLEIVRLSNRKLREWGNIEYQRAEWLLNIKQ